MQSAILGEFTLNKFELLKQTRITVIKNTVELCYWVPFTYCMRKHWPFAFTVSAVIRNGRFGTITDKCHKYEAFPLVQCIRRYMQNGPLIILVLV